MRTLLSLIICFGSVVSAAAESAPPTAQEIRQVMGTMATVQVWALDRCLASAAIDTAFGVFGAVDSLMSTWNGNSKLGRLNTASADAWVDVGPDVSRVLEAAVEVSGLTGGAFDPTVLPLVRLWGFRGGTPEVPRAAVLAEALSLVDAKLLEVDGERARLRRAGMAVDLGGIAKGYALDRAAEAMIKAGAFGGMLDLGGNLLVFGQGPVPAVGIIDPADPEKVALSIPLSAGAVATSGQYEQFVAVNGQSYGHVLDPRTGWPVTAGYSATVVAPEALWADALATAVLVMGVEQGLRLLEDLPGVEGLVIGPDGIRMTSGLAATP